MNGDIRCTNPNCGAVIPAGSVRCSACGQPAIPLPPTAGTVMPYAVAPAARPGGLTALAIINFVVAAFGCFGVAALFGGSAFMNSEMMNDPRVTSQMSDKQKADMAQARELMSSPTIKALSALDGVKAILLLVAGIGYLKMKKVMGRMIGNVYAVTSLASLAAGLLLIPTSVSGGIGLASFIGVIYPVLTLVLINGTFKNDLVN